MPRDITSPSRGRVLTMRGFKRRKADPSILRNYEDLRNERRYPYLYMAALALRAIAIALLIPIFFIPSSARLTYMSVWMVCALLAIITQLALMVNWSQHGQRWRSFWIIVGVLATVAVMVIAMDWLMGQVI